MRLQRITSEGFRALGAHKLRTFLMMAGTIIGVAAPIVIMAIGRGTQKKVMKRVRNFGPRAMMLIAGGGKLRSAWANIGVIMVKCSDPKLAFADFGSAHSFGASSSLLPYGVPLTIGSLIILCGQVFNWWML